MPFDERLKMGSISNKEAPEPKSWEATAQISRDVLENSIPKQWLLQPEQLPPADRMDVRAVPVECGLLTPAELEMTSQDAAGLLRRYESGEWTVVDVTTAFLKRATIGHQLLNFATEFLADDALATAHELDAHFQKIRTLRGPLHGIPISVKEHVAIGGRICNASFVSKISNIAPEDAHIVKLLRNAGAIIHVRTNQPQSIMHLDTNNNITGMTLNPVHRLLSPAGSSGGEGASIGFRCAVLGVGTDIGGSIRAPASFCDNYGFRPTALRNPSLGLVGVMGGQESIRGCVGPLANSMEDLILFEKAIWNQQPWDTETILVPLPWRDAIVKREELVVGVMYDDGLVRPHPPVLRALQDAEKKLQASGIKTVKWEPYKHDRGREMLASLYTADGGNRVRTALQASGEPALPLTDFVLNIGRKEPLSIEENWDLNFEREAYRRAYHARMKAAGVDVILCPGYLGVGALQGTPKYWNYTSIWNLLDQPAVSFPSGVWANKTVDVVDATYTPRSELEREEQAAYDPELFDGIRVSLQLVGKHHRDEKLLESAKLVEEALRSADCP